MKMKTNKPKTQNAEPKACYVALIEGTYSIPNDTEVIIGPGDTYNGHHIIRKNFIEFDNIDDLTSWVQLQESSVFKKTKYKIFKCTPMKVTTRFEVEVDIHES